MIQIFGCREMLWGGVKIFSAEYLQKHNCNVIVSPYYYEEIETWLKANGYQENNDYFIAKRIDIPAIPKTKIQIGDDLFSQIRKNTDIEKSVPFPVYAGERIMAYYRTDPSFMIFDKVLNSLLSNKKTDCIKYLNIPEAGIVLREWDELSEKVIRFFQRYEIPVGFDPKLLQSAWREISFIRDHIIETEDSSSCLPVEQDYSFIIDLLTYSELAESLSYAVQLQRKGVNIVVVRLPEFEELEESTAAERFRNEKNITGYSEFSDDREEQIRRVYGDDYEKWKNREIGNIGQYYIGDFACLRDVSGRYTNVENGRRRTTRQPENYKNKIYTMGPCIIGGAYVTDDHTIPSLLQKELNAVYKDSFCVENLGICGGVRSYLERIRELDLYEGDFVVIADIFPADLVNGFGELTVIDTLHAFQQREGDVFFEKPIHMNRFGNRLVTDEIFSHVNWNINACSDHLVQKGSKIQSDLEDKYEHYKNVLQDIWNRIPDTVHHCGAIVMNCNPFTYGHLHLIEEARKSTDFLFLFVVEEDKSFFPFVKRFEMVKAACREFDDVMVLPSGKIILSSYTMPEYFRKEDLQDVLINPAKDVSIFGEMIAPVLHISRRFVGEEPFDTVTEQYNACMKKILPEYGVEVVEIPRLQKGGETVCATKVREAMRRGDRIAVRKMVPESTFSVIREMME